MPDNWRDLHERAQSEHLLAEITRLEAIRDRYAPNSIEYVRAQREIDLLHERVRRRRNAA